ncbi:AcrR family transcriptional regulator [Yoonia maritima]|uniref:AcrR family transcriptional regulator n=1 Tax=Yoonia maritima TaxID=1435347 RepID=A0A2T0W015_9RHOB|nr:TetR/AcrR family transcriptional regulator [Yoonia maritima]PRY78097.1 AcrR family transcriptional regulator [Yoonia maritima]
MAEKNQHHHGNLRPALIDAGIEVLKAEGLSALSLRKVAAIAGVSHAAPAHHFDGKNGLLLAIAAEGFRTFIRYMEESRAVAGPAPQAKLLGICHGYLSFAKDHDALFQLIFSPDIKNNTDTELTDAAQRAFGVLADTCALFEPSPSHPQGNEMMVWSLVHGFATLRRFHQTVPPTSNQPIQFSDILPRLTPRK